MLDLRQFAGRPNARSRAAGSLPCQASGSNPLTTGLIAVDRAAGGRMCRINPVATKVLPMSVPVAVMKNAVIALGLHWPSRP